MWRVHLAATHWCGLRLGPGQRSVSSLDIKLRAKAGHDLGHATIGSCRLEASVHQRIVQLLRGHHHLLLGHLLVGLLRTDDDQIERVQQGWAPRGILDVIPREEVGREVHERRKKHVGRWGTDVHVEAGNRVAALLHLVRVLCAVKRADEDGDEDLREDEEEKEVHQKVHEHQANRVVRIDFRVDRRAGNQHIEDLKPEVAKRAKPAVFKVEDAKELAVHRGEAGTGDDDQHAQAEDRVEGSCDGRDELCDGLERLRLLERTHEHEELVGADQHDPFWHPAWHLGFHGVDNERHDPRGEFKEDKALGHQATSQCNAHA